MREVISIHIGERGGGPGGAPRRDPGRAAPRRVQIDRRRRLGAAGNPAARLGASGARIRAVGARDGRRPAAWPAAAADGQPAAPRPAL